MSDLKIAAEINTKDNVVVFRVGGAMSTAAQFLSAYEEVLDNPGLVQNMHAIWDVSGVDIKNVPIAEVRHLPGAINKVVSRRGAGFKVAIVTSRSSDLLLMKLYLSFLRIISTVSLRVFGSIPEATAWIGNSGRTAKGA